MNLLLEDVPFVILINELVEKLMKVLFFHKVDYKTHFVIFYINNLDITLYNIHNIRNFIACFFFLIIKI